MHQFLQFMDFDCAEQDIRAEIGRLVAQRFFTPQEAGILDPQVLSRFFDTKLYRRMKASERSGGSAASWSRSTMGYARETRGMQGGRSSSRASATMSLRKTESL